LDAAVWPEDFTITGDEGTYTLLFVMHHEFPGPFIETAVIENPAVGDRAQRGSARDYEIARCMQSPAPSG
jgi:hypothetical protein